MNILALILQLACGPKQAPNASFDAISAHPDLTTLSRIEVVNHGHELTELYCANRDVDFHIRRRNDVCWYKYTGSIKLDDDQRVVMVYDAFPSQEVMQHLERTVRIQEHIIRAADITVQEIESIPKDQFRSTNLTLQNLEEISPEFARAITNVRLNELALPSVSTISIPVLQLLAVSQFSTLDLSGLTEITADQLNALQGYQGVLILDGLTNLTPEAMMALSKINITGLELNGLTELTGDLGIHIAKIPGLSSARDIMLSFNGATVVEPAFLDALVAIKGKRFGLRLNGLQQISSETTAALGRLHVNELWLNGLTTLDKSLAEAIHTLPLYHLSLAGLQNFSAADFEPLTTFANADNYLQLDLGLSKVTREQAEALSKIPAGRVQTLFFIGLSEIDKETANGLNLIKTEMYFPAVTELPTESAQVFKNNERLMFFGALTSVQPELIHLMKNNETLRFSLANLTQLDIKQAAAIQNLTFIDRMELRSLQTLSPETAKALGTTRITYSGELVLENISEIDAETIDNLTIEARMLILSGLKSIPPELARSLSQKTNYGVIILDGLTCIEPASKDILDAFEGTIRYLGKKELCTTNGEEHSTQSSTTTQ